MSSRPLKVCVECHPDFGRGIHRVVAALKRYAPAGVEIVDTPEDADHVIHHIVGVQNFDPHATIDERISSHHRPYSMIQYCLRTTERPDLVWWKPLWDGAAAVWSYYDIHAWCLRELESGIDGFLRLPLGVDPTDFHPYERPAIPTYGLVTSGHVAATECVGECADACAVADVRMAHLGPRLPELQGAAHVDCFEGVSDAELAGIYRASRYVAGLRRVEGFELPAAEGLLCGARPICFAREHYTHWFDGPGVYVREDSADLVGDLAAILAVRPRPMAAVEHGLAQRTFSWGRLCGLFWQRVVERAGTKRV